MYVKRVVVTVLFLASLVPCSYCLSCACNPRKCPVVTSCPYGSGLDPCFCCTVCNLGPGETCGGPFDIAGRCGMGLTCVKTRPRDINLEGVCREGTGGTFSPQKPEQQPLGTSHQSFGTPQQPLGPLQQPLGPLQQPLGPLQQPLGPLQQPLGAPHQPLSSDSYQPIHFPGTGV
ncbi:Growth factor receptor cysteine-rich domain [Trinorchestia longiramus]|nr:Growth factor receptor cysteine-rich domain [Trinorchestia longiramus]